MLNRQTGRMEDAEHQNFVGKVMELPKLPPLEDMSAGF